eukprot:gene422-680_t
MAGAAGRRTAPAAAAYGGSRGMHSSSMPHHVSQAVPRNSSLPGQLVVVDPDALGPQPAQANSGSTVVSELRLKVTPNPTPQISLNMMVSMRRVVEVAAHGTAEQLHTEVEEVLDEEQHVYGYQGLKDILTVSGINWKYVTLYVPFLVPFVIASLLCIDIN